jgi:hypothetical protein
MFINDNPHLIGIIAGDNLVDPITEALFEYIG